MKTEKTALRPLLTIGGISALACAAGSLADVGLGMATGGSALPLGALGHLSQLAASPWLGLYNLDLLNLCTTILMLPAFYALYLVLKAGGSRLAGLALALFLAGLAVFVANNPALPMLGLAGPYAAAQDEQGRSVLIAAAEGLLAKGAHGSPGALPGFLLVILSNLGLCGAMAGGRTPFRLAGILGLVGNALLAAYLVLVTFVPPVKELATLFAAPGGLLSIAWLVISGLGLLSSRAADAPV